MRTKKKLTVALLCCIILTIATPLAVFAMKHAECSCQDMGCCCGGCEGDGGCCTVYPGSCQGAFVDCAYTDGSHVRISCS